MSWSQIWINECWLQVREWWGLSRQVEWCNVPCQGGTGIGTVDSIEPESICWIHIQPEENHEVWIINFSAIFYYSPKEAHCGKFDIQTLYDSLIWILWCEVYWELMAKGYLRSTGKQFSLSRNQHQGIVSSSISDWQKEEAVRVCQDLGCFTRVLVCLCAAGWKYPTRATRGRKASFHAQFEGSVHHGGKAWQQNPNAVCRLSKVLLPLSHFTPSFGCGIASSTFRVG